MEQCTQCGHALGIGRYCVNCGHLRGAVPDDEWRTSTAERPGAAVRDDPSGATPPTALPERTGQVSPGPATPPPVFQSPPKARYPMYADDPAPDAPPSAEPPAWESPTTVLADRTRRRSPALWVAVPVVLLLVAGLGVFLLVGGAGGDDDQAADRTPASDAGRDDASSAGDSDPAGSPQPEPSEPEPTSPTSAPAPVDPRDVTTEARVVTPVTAPPGQDVRGDPVSYDAANMLDGRPDTGWRMPGDGTGATITFTLPSPTRLTSLGLLNGYAKRDPGYDGYRANRRILEVEWTFSDGAQVRQTLGNARQVQSIDVDTVTTTVVLRIVSVSAPGKGPSGRDYTAISDVSLVGEATE